jgi:hypothetical protein
MPEIITEPLTFKGRGTSIPWAQYFADYAGQVVKFTAGTDFDIKPRSFGVAAWEYAKRNQLGKVQTKVTDDYAIISFPAAGAGEIEGQEAIPL